MNRRNERRKKKHMKTKNPKCEQWIGGKDQKWKSQRATTIAHILIYNDIIDR